MNNNVKTLIEELEDEKHVNYPEAPLEQYEVEYNRGLDVAVAKVRDFADKLEREDMVEKMQQAYWQNVKKGEPMKAALALIIEHIGAKP